MRERVLGYWTLAWFGLISNIVALPVIALINEATIVDKDLILELLNLDEISDAQFRTFISLLKKYSILDHSYY